ncbi:hypothetical protein ABZ626_23645 [Streptomyces longispororuber]|uniref:hypothetical protein n=1 Tax=Streptomyces longispororuber TaxID=68230 RepID=UPI0033E5E3E1
MLAAMARAAATPLRRTGRTARLGPQGAADGQAPRPRAATDTARALLNVGDRAGAFAQLRLVKLAAPGYAA